MPAYKILLDFGGFSYVLLSYFITAPVGDSCTKKIIIMMFNYIFVEGVLCAGTNKGNVIMWKRSNSVSGAEDWTEISTCKMEDKIVYSTWGSQHAAIVTADSLFILQEHELCSTYNKKVGEYDSSSCIKYIGKQ